MVVPTITGNRVSYVLNINKPPLSIVSSGNMFRFKLENRNLNPKSARFVNLLDECFKIFDEPPVEINTLISTLTNRSDLDLFTHVGFTEAETLNLLEFFHTVNFMIPESDDYYSAIAKASESLSNDLAWVPQLFRLFIKSISHPIGSHQIAKVLERLLSEISIERQNFRETTQTEIEKFKAEKKRSGENLAVLENQDDEPVALEDNRRAYLSNSSLEILNEILLRGSSLDAFQLEDSQKFHRIDTQFANLQKIPIGTSIDDMLIDHLLTLEPIVFSRVFKQIRNFIDQSFVRTDIHNIMQNMGVQQSDYEILNFHDSYYISIDQDKENLIQDSEVVLPISGFLCNIEKLDQFNLKLKTRSANDNFDAIFQITLSSKTDENDESNIIFDFVKENVRYIDIDSSVHPEFVDISIISSVSLNSGKCIKFCLPFKKNGGNLFVSGTVFSSCVYKNSHETEFKYSVKLLTKACYVITEIEENQMFTTVGTRIKFLEKTIPAKSLIYGLSCLRNSNTSFLFSSQKLQARVIHNNDINGTFRFLLDVEEFSTDSSTLSPNVREDLFYLMPYNAMELYTQVVLRGKCDEGFLVFQENYDQLSRIVENDVELQDIVNRVYDEVRDNARSIIDFYHDPQKSGDVDMLVIISDEKVSTKKFANVEYKSTISYRSRPDIPLDLMQADQTEVPINAYLENRIFEEIQQMREALERERMINNFNFAVENLPYKTQEFESKFYISDVQNTKYLSEDGNTLAIATFSSVDVYFKFDQNFDMVSLLNHENVSNVLFGGNFIVTVSDETSKLWLAINGTEVADLQPHVLNIGDTVTGFVRTSSNDKTELKDVEITRILRKIIPNSQQIDNRIEWNRVIPDFYYKYEYYTGVDNTDLIEKPKLKKSSDNFCFSPTGRYLAYNFHLKTENDTYMMILQSKDPIGAKSVKRNNVRVTIIKDLFTMTDVKFISNGNVIVNETDNLTFGSFKTGAWSFSTDNSEIFTCVTESNQYVSAFPESRIFQSTKYYESLPKKVSESSLRTQSDNEFLNDINIANGKYKESCDFWIYDVFVEPKLIKDTNIMRVKLTLSGIPEAYMIDINLIEGFNEYISLEENTIYKNSNDENSGYVFDGKVSNLAATLLQNLEFVFNGPSVRDIRFVEESILSKKSSPNDDLPNISFEGNYIFSFKISDTEVGSFSYSFDSVTLKVGTTISRFSAEGRIDYHINDRVTPLFYMSDDESLLYVFSDLFQSSSLLRTDESLFREDKQAEKLFISSLQRETNRNDQILIYNRIRNIQFDEWKAGKDLNVDDFPISSMLCLNRYNRFRIYRDRELFNFGADNSNHKICVLGNLKLRISDQTLYITPANVQAPTVEFIQKQFYEELTNMSDNAARNEYFKFKNLKETLQVDIPELFRYNTTDTVIYKIIIRGHPMTPITDFIRIEFRKLDKFVRDRIADSIGAEDPRVATILKFENFRVMNMFLSGRSLIDIGYSMFELYLEASKTGNQRDATNIFNSLNDLQSIMLEVKIPCLEYMKSRESLQNPGLTNEERTTMKDSQRLPGYFAFDEIKKQLSKIQNVVNSKKFIESLGGNVDKNSPAISEAILVMLYNYFRLTPGTNPHILLIFKLLKLTEKISNTRKTDTFNKIISKCTNVSSILNPQNCEYNNSTEFMLTSSEISEPTKFRNNIISKFNERMQMLESMAPEESSFEKFRSKDVSTMLQQLTEKFIRYASFSPEFFNQRGEPLSIVAYNSQAEYLYRTNVETIVDDEVDNLRMILTGVLIDDNIDEDLRLERQNLIERVLNIRYRNLLDLQENRHRKITKIGPIKSYIKNAHENSERLIKSEQEKKQNIRSMQNALDNYITETRANSNKVNLFTLLLKFRRNIENYNVMLDFRKDKPTDFARIYGNLNPQDYISEANEKRSELMRAIGEYRDYEKECKKKNETPLSFDECFPGFQIKSIQEIDNKLSKSIDIFTDIFINEVRRSTEGETQNELLSLIDKFSENIETYENTIRQIENFSRGVDETNRHFVNFFNRHRDLTFNEMIASFVVENILNPNLDVELDMMLQNLFDDDESLFETTGVNESIKRKFVLKTENATTDDIVSNETIIEYDETKKDRKGGTRINIAQLKTEKLKATEHKISKFLIAEIYGLIYRVDRDRLRIIRSAEYYAEFKIWLENLVEDERKLEHDIEIERIRKYKREALAKEKQREMSRRNMERFKRGAVIDEEYEEESTEIEKTLRLPSKKLTDLIFEYLTAEIIKYSKFVAEPISDINREEIAESAFVNLINQEFSYQLYNLIERIFKDRILTDAIDLTLENRRILFYSLIEILDKIMENVLSDPLSVIRRKNSQVKDIETILEDIENTKLITELKWLEHHLKNKQNNFQDRTLTINEFEIQVQAELIACVQTLDSINSRRLIAFIKNMRTFSVMPADLMQELAEIRQSKRCQLYNHYWELKRLLAAEIKIGTGWTAIPLSVLLRQLTRNDKFVEDETINWITQNANNTNITMTASMNFFRQYHIPTLKQDIDNLKFRILAGNLPDSTRSKEFEEMEELLLPFMRQYRNGYFFNGEVKIHEICIEFPKKISFLDLSDKTDETSYIGLAYENGSSKGYEIKETFNLDLVDVIKSACGSYNDKVQYLREIYRHSAATVVNPNLEENDFFNLSRIVARNDTKIIFYQLVMETGIKPFNIKNLIKTIQQNYTDESDQIQIFRGSNANVRSENLVGQGFSKVISKLMMKAYDITTKFETKEEIKALQFDSGYVKMMVIATPNYSNLVYTKGTDDFSFSNYKLTTEPKLVINREKSPQYVFRVANGINNQDEKVGIVAFRNIITGERRMIETPVHPHEALTNSKIEIVIEAGVISYRYRNNRTFNETINLSDLARFKPVAELTNSDFNDATYGRTIVKSDFKRVISYSKYTIAAESKNDTIKISTNWGKNFKMNESIKQVVVKTRNTHFGSVLRITNLDFKQKSEYDEENRKHKSDNEKRVQHVVNWVFPQLEILDVSKVYGDGNSSYIKILGKSVYGKCVRVRFGKMYIKENQNSLIVHNFDHEYNIRDSRLSQLEKAKFVSGDADFVVFCGKFLDNQVKTVINIVGIDPVHTITNVKPTNIGISRSGKLLCINDGENVEIYNIKGEKVENFNGKSSIWI